MIDRISGRESFRRFHGARRFRTGLFTLVVADPPPGTRHAAVAFAVPRRVGGAVVRNRIRRRLREGARDLERRGALPVRWYLVVVHPPAAAAATADLWSELARATARVSGTGAR